MGKLFTTALATLLFWMFCPLAAAAGQSLPPLLSQEIRVTLVPAEHLLRGESTFTYAGRPDSLTMDLATTASIDQVSSAGQAVPYTFNSGSLRVTLPRAADGPLSVSIRYRLTLNDPLPLASAGSEDPSYGISGSISSKGVFLGSDAGWYPRPPAAPPRRTIHIIAPAGMEGITAGERLSRETTSGVTRSTWQEQPAVGDLALAAGPYLVKERQLSGNLLVSTYLYPESAHLADAYLDASAGYLRSFAALFGSYPFAKFAVVENFFPTGYGFPSFTLLGSTVIRLPFIITTSLPHEIAHSWWGNGVLVNPDQGNWSEGLVTYLADYLLEERKGEVAGRDYRLRLLTDFSLLAPAPLDFPLAGFNSRVDPASRAIGYGKGAMLWHMLRRRVGDEHFFAALREVFRTRRFQSADWSYFSQALSNSSGLEIDSFLASWLNRPGGARLALAGVRRQRQPGGWLVTGTVVQTPPLFPLQLPLRLETVDGPVDQTLTVSREQTPFRFLTSAQPSRLLLDPEVDTFRLLTAEQLPANVNRLKGSKRLLAVTTPGCGANAIALQKLLEALGQGKTTVITEAELSRVESRDHDLIFCGLPQGAAALFDFPPGLEPDQSGFVVKGERFSAAPDLLFLVTRQRRAPQQIAALFLPLSPQAATNAVPKISHYGSYASLVFSSGVNRHKGRGSQQPAGDQVTFPAAEEP